MVSLQEMQNLKERMVALLQNCLEHKCVSLAKEASARSGAEATSGDLFFVFSKDTKSEMVEIMGRIGFLLTRLQKTVSAGPLAICDTNQGASKQSIAQLVKDQITESDTKPTDAISRLTLDSVPQFDSLRVTNMRGVKRDHIERIKVAVGFYLGLNPRPNIAEVAKKFGIKIVWLAETLMENGYELSGSCISKAPFLILSKDQASFPTKPSPFKLLEKDVQDQLTANATQWASSGQVVFRKKLKDHYKHLTPEQRQDVLDFYQKHREQVSARWIVEQICKKYQMDQEAMARCVAFLLVEKSGKTIKDDSQRRKFYQLEDKKDLILNYASNHPPDQLYVQQMIRIFNLKCDNSVLSKFLKKHGYEVLTGEDRRAKKLADKGLPYTRAQDPHRAKRYYENQKRARKAAAPDDGSATKPKRAAKKEVTTKVTRVTKSPANKATLQATSSIADEQWEVEFETDQAIARLNDQASAGAAAAAATTGAGGSHQYETRTRQGSNYGSNQFNRYY